jgi:hypothetical protein
MLNRSNEPKGIKIMADKFIAVRVQSVYGNDTVYPVDGTAASFCALTMRKTLTRRDLMCIKDLGYEIRVAGGKLPFAL